MYIGTYQVGREVTYRVHTTNASKTPQAPDEAPLMFLYDANGTTIYGGRSVPSRDYPLKTGLFEGRIFLDERFEVGNYTLRVSWLVSGTEFSRTLCFEVIPASDGSGQVLSMYYFQKPNANYLVQGRDSGRIYKGKNPRV